MGKEEELVVTTREDEYEISCFMPTHVGVSQNRLGSSPVNVGKAWKRSLEKLEYDSEVYDVNIKL